MFNIRTRRATVALVASFALFDLAACGGGSEEPTPQKTSSSEPAPTEPAAEPAGQPSWAKPATEVGDKISTFKAGDITVDAYQVGITKATKSGQFVDPETNKPIIAEGDDIVFVNYVITNNGAPIDLGFSLVNITARYADWKFMQGMDSVVDRVLFEVQKVNSDVLAPGAFKDPGVYTLGKGAGTIK